MCCRDYDGSLVVGSLNEKSNIEQIMKDADFINLREAHENYKSDKIKNYNLCSSCYVVDARIQQIWHNTIMYLLYKQPNESSDFYQRIVLNLMNCLNNINKENYNNFLLELN